MANNHIERGSALDFRELQVTNTAGAFIQLLTWPKVQRLATQCRQGYRGTRTFIHCRWAYKVVHPLRTAV